MTRKFYFAGLQLTQSIHVMRFVVPVLVEVGPLQVCDVLEIRETGCEFQVLWVGRNCVK